MPERPRRPVRRPDLVELIAAGDAIEPFRRTEIATATAVAVISQGRAAGGESLVDLAEKVGLDTLADLWRGEPPASLPGALWALYLLRRWCRGNGPEVSRLYRAGLPLAPVDEVVAGAPDSPDPQAMVELADAVLTGAYDGDFAVALERAAAFFRIIAAGRVDLAGQNAERGRELTLADRNREVAEGLAAAAGNWRRNPI
jgi:hypothetical protein